MDEAGGEAQARGAKVGFQVGAVHIESDADDGPIDPFASQFVLDEDARDLGPLDEDVVGPFDTHIAGHPVSHHIVHCQRSELAEEELILGAQTRWPYHQAEGEVETRRGAPGAATLTSSCRLLMGQNDSTMSQLRQGQQFGCMFVGAVHTVQFHQLLAHDRSPQGEHWFHVVAVLGRELRTFERTKIDRMKNAQGANAARLVDAIVKGIQEVKGKDIVHLDMRGVPNSVCEHFVICHGDSTTQVDAIYGSVEKMVREQIAEKPWHTEGQSNREWILMDYVNVVVHIFLRDKRGFYALEDLWGDAARKAYDNVA
jgi:ribosome-associated protein